MDGAPRGLQTAAVGQRSVVHVDVPARRRRTHDEAACAKLRARVAGRAFARRMRAEHRVRPSVNGMRDQLRVAVDAQRDVAAIALEVREARFERTVVVHDRARQRRRFDLFDVAALEHELSAIRAHAQIIKGGICGVKIAVERLNERITADAFETDAGIAGVDDARSVIVAEVKISVLNL